MQPSVPRYMADVIARLVSVAAWFGQILLPGRRIPEPSLLWTHPPTDARVDRLRELSVETHPPLRSDASRLSPIRPGHVRTPRFGRFGLYW